MKPYKKRSQLRGGPLKPTNWQYTDEPIRMTQQNKTMSTLSELIEQALNSLAKGRPVAAEALLTTARQMVPLPSVPRPQSLNTLSALARTHMQVGRHRQALPILQAALHSRQHCLSAEQVGCLCLHLCSVYSRLGDHYLSLGYAL